MKKEDTLCVKCGACTVVCPVYQVTGRESHTARGKQLIMARLEKGERSAAYGELLSKCLLCGACRQVCPRGLETPQLVIEARSESSRFSSTTVMRSLACQALARPALLAGLFKAGSAADRLFSSFLPAESGLRLRLALCRPDSISPPAGGSYIESLDHAPVADAASTYFIGCLANHLQPAVAAAVENLVHRISGHPLFVPTEQGCCGLAFLAGGDLQQARKLARKNIAAFEGDERPILTSCASCYAHLSSYPDLFTDSPEWRQRAEVFAGRLQEFSRFMLAAVGERADAFFQQTAPKRRVLYHDPCHLRFGPQITGEPRQLLAQLAGVQIVELPGGSKCCGQGGLFHIMHPDIAARISGGLMAGFDELSPELVVSSCSGCLLQWRQAVKRHDPSCQVVHLAELLASYLRA
jgi:glycolate oxidase iron-sulfur subunit